MTVNANDSGCRSPVTGATPGSRGAGSATGTSGASRPATGDGPRRRPPGARKCAMTLAQRSRSGRPAEHAVRGEHDVELALEVRGKVVDVAPDEPGRDPGFGRQRPGRLDGRLGEVHAGHDRAPASPGEAVQAEVTLQVEQRLVAHVPDQRDLEDVEPRPAARAPGLEALDVVELRPDVVRGPGVPEPPVGLPVLVHAPYTFRRGSRTSRRPSPRRFMASTVSMMPSPGNVEIHHASRR
jgi:hypothetical protein